MSQILDHIPDDNSHHILCCYVNATSRIQIARITNIPNWYFERVVFPGQRLVFEAEPIATLEIHSGMMASAILSDTIPCSKLSLHQVEQEQAQLLNGKVTSIDEVKTNPDMELKPLCLGRGTVDRAKDSAPDPRQVSSSVNLAV